MGEGAEQHLQNDMKMFFLSSFRHMRKHNKEKKVFCLFLIFREKSQTQVFFFFP